MKRVSRFVAAAALVAAVIAPVAADGPRLLVDIDEPFVLQGRPCPAGTVSVRLISAHNAATTLHEVWIGEECLGVFLAERVRVDTAEARDTIRLERDARGRLILLGYTVRVGNGVEFYRFASSPKIASRLA